MIGREKEKDTQINIRLTLVQRAKLLKASCDAKMTLSRFILAKALADDAQEVERLAGDGSSRRDIVAPVASSTQVLADSEESRDYDTYDRKKPGWYVTLGDFGWCLLCRHKMAKRWFVVTGQSAQMFLSESEARVFIDEHDVTV
jgi:hypothetical protein